MPDPADVTGVHVIPLKNGCWRVVRVADDLDHVPGSVRLSPAMYERWVRAYEGWWNRNGHRLAISPEMWAEN